jgi:hypothetical protein
MSTVLQSKAMRKAETNKEYLDANAEDFSPELQHLLAQQREIYTAFKQKKAEIVARLREEMVCAPGREPVGTAFTRWGQWVVVIGDKPAPKVAGAKRHKTYAEYRAQVEGRNA